MKSIMQIICALSVIILISCGTEKESLSSPQIEEEKLDGSITGNLVDQAGIPLEGVNVTLFPGGYSSVSNLNGEFTIPKVEEGKYDIEFTSPFIQDTIISGVELLEDQDLLIDEIVLKNENAKIDSIIDENLDSLENQVDSLLRKRDVIGELLGSQELLMQVSRVQIAVFGPNEDSISSDTALIGEDKKSFSLNMYFPKSGGNVKISVFSIDSALMGFYETQFDNNTAPLIIPDFKVDNRVPVVSIKGDLTLLRFQDFGLTASVEDNDNSSLNFHWELDEALLRSGGLKDSSILVKGFDIVSDSLVIGLSVEDADGNIVQDSIVLGTRYFTDARDQKVYSSIRIGNQTWMSENLAFNQEYFLATQFCIGDLEENCQKYGRMYDWTTAVGANHAFLNEYWSDTTGYVQGLCPSGWHVPSYEEWDELRSTVDSLNGDQSSDVSLFSEDALDLLVPTNEFGFNVLASGWRSGSNDVNEGIGAGFWTKTQGEIDGDEADYFFLVPGGLSDFWNPKANGFYLRCLLDEDK